jgi:hypothetical protein
MSHTKVGMKSVKQKIQCASIRGKTHPGERCTAAPLADSEWCGRHHKQAKQVRWAPSPGPGPGDIIEIKDKEPVSPRREADIEIAANKIRRFWMRSLARRAGPLLWSREESNNPFDFFSSDPVEEIPIQYFISFVDAGKGYTMDSRSAISLIEHATTNHTTPENPFNRATLPALFMKRLGRHTGTAVWSGLTALTEEQKMTLAVTDLFRKMEDLGYYTDPTWFMDMTRQQLQCWYIEMADIWFHRATLTASDRNRVVPGRSPFRLPVNTAIVMQQKALRPLLLETCTSLVSAAASRSDQQLGVMYVLGALSVVSSGAGGAYPWLVDMFAPGVTRIVGSQIAVAHPSVLAY